MKRAKKLFKSGRAKSKKSFLQGTNNITLEALERRMLLSTMWADMDSGAEIPGATDGSDIFYGDKSDNVADALGGNDLLFGLGGNDTLFGGWGNDVLCGGWHDDSLYGGQGHDKLCGSWGNDILDGGAGDDKMCGGGQRDILISGAGDDYMDGGKQNDTFFFTGSENGDVKTVVGGHGNDTIDLIEFGVGAVSQEGWKITVALGGGESFRINYRCVENILVATGPVTEISIDNVSLHEGDNGTTLFNFTVSLSEQSLNPVTVDFGTADDTAAAGSDYQAVSGTLTFAPGHTSRVIQVPVIGDTDVESDEMFFLNLANPGNALIADGQGIGTILNDDMLAPTLSIDDASIVEGDQGAVNAVFTVRMSDTSSETVMADFATADGSARSGLDYAAINGTLTFRPGDTVKMIQIPAVGDTEVEPDETFFVNLSNPSHAIIADGQAEGTIINDDVLVPVLSIDDVSVMEGDDGTINAVFMINLSHPSSVEVTLDYATADNTAAAGADYQAVSGTLTIIPGEATKRIEVPVIGETEVERDEMFFINLTNLSNVIVADNQAAGTIINDDMPGLSIEDYSIVEGDRGAVNAVFGVNLSGSSPAAITVDFSTADDTALSGSDYAPVSGTLIFAPGETTKTIQVPVVGDTEVEFDETFRVNLVNPNNALIADGQALGTIENDDIATLSIDDQTVVESGGGTVSAVFTVSLSSPSAAPVRVDFATADDTAVSGSDYAATSGTLIFSGGVTTQTIEVLVTDDAQVEPDEAFLVNLSNPSNALIADGEAVGTIISDDIEIMPPEITVFLGKDEISDGQVAPVIDFGVLVQGQYESNLAFTVRNDGDETLILGEIMLPAGYSLAEGLPMSLAADESDSFTVQLDTIEVGVKAGQISLAHNDADENPFNFVITGEVLGPEITVFAESGQVADEQAGVINFGSIRAGEGEPAMTFTVRNDGSYELLLEGVVLPDGFSFGADSLVARLAPGGSDTFSVVMGGATVATPSGQMTITSNDRDEGVFEIPLGGVVWDVILDRGRKTIVRFADLDGRLTNVMLKGPGAIEVQSSEYALPAVALTETTVKSKLVAEGAYKKAESTLYDVISDGSLQAITGKKTDLQGVIDLRGSLNQLVLDDIYAGAGVITGQAGKGLKVRADEVADDVTFDIADKVKSFNTSTFSGGALAADSIKSLKVKFGSLGAAVTSRVGEIGSVKVRQSIEGDIVSNTFIGKVISQAGGLAPDAALIALGGDINSARFAGEVAGNIIAEGKIARLSGRQGALTGVVRAGDRIGTVSFENIEGAVISSLGDIYEVWSRNSIVDSFILAGYDVGADGRLGGLVADVLNMDGATISSVMTSPRGNFNGSMAMAGVQPQCDADTGKWGPGPEEQRVTADFGEIMRVRLGQVWQGNADDPYGLFAATNIREVKISEILTASGAPDFQVWPSATPNGDF